MKDLYMWVLVGARRRFWIPWSRRSKRLWATHVSAGKSRKFSLSLGAISPAPPAKLPFTLLCDQAPCPVLWSWHHCDWAHDQLLETSQRLFNIKAFENDWASEWLQILATWKDPGLETTCGLTYTRNFICPLACKLFKDILSSLLNALPQDLEECLAYAV